MLEILIFFCCLFINSTNQNKTAIKSDNFLSKPIFEDDPYILLMFNGTSDLNDFAVFSDYKEKDKSNKKYTGSWNVEVTDSTPFINDYSLIMNGESAYSAVAFGLIKPFEFKSSCLVVQYDTRFPTDHDCGGAYIKLISESHSINLKYFSNSTPYTIMFGPDKCGMDYEIKFLFQYIDQSTGELKERKFKDADATYPRFVGDNVTHLYTLMICENNSVQIFKDLRLIKEGNLLLDFEPSLEGEPYIVDPSDSKPDDWDEKKEILDHMDKKPDDWDENEQEFIADLSATKPKKWLENEPFMIKSEKEKPNNWDEEEKGKWNPPMIRNPKCKLNGCGPWSPPKIRNNMFRGKWKPSLIKNPNYKGEWKPRLIKNPRLNSEVNAYKKLKPFNALGIEIFSAKMGIVFDNFLITDNFTSARAFAMQTWWPKYKVEIVDMPEYEEIFNKTNNNHKTSLREYTHWFWASVPLAIGIPFLSYIALLIKKKANRDPDLIREKCLLRAYELLKINEELYPNYPLEENIDSFLLEKEDLSELDNPKEEINQLFERESDKIAAIIRKRISRKANFEKMQSPTGDVF